MNYRKLLAIFMALIVSAAAGNTAEISVFAAASLSDSLKEIAGRYLEKTGDKIVFNFAASGILARQIEEGAPADIFISADEARMDALEKKGWIDKASRSNLLGNTLAIVAATDSPASYGSPKDLTGAEVKRIAVGDAKTVPAGTYAKEYLTGLGLWEGISPKIIPCENVRSVLAAVESGNVEAGIVYKTDAAISKKVKIVFEVPLKDWPKIIYPAALTKESKQPAAAGKFLTHLASDEARRIFEKYGFIVLNPKSP